MDKNEPIKDQNKVIEIMSENEYLSKRVDKKIGYYNSKTKKHKWLYIVFKWLGILTSALIPLIIALKLPDATNRTITAILGFASTIFAGTLSLIKSHELWIEYSKTAASLKREKYLFKTRSGPYIKTNSFKGFVDTIESIISKENLTWVDCMNEEIQMINEKNNNNTPNDDTP